MKKGNFGISDIIVFVLFALLVLAFIGILSWDRSESPSPALVQKPTEGFVLTSYLRTPVNEDVNGDGEVDARQVIDLVALAYKDPAARGALEAEFEGVRRILEREGQPSAFRAVYPGDEVVQTSNLRGIPLDASTLEGKDAAVPLPDGREARVYYDQISEAEETAYKKQSGDTSVERE